MLNKDVLEVQLDTQSYWKMSGQIISIICDTGTKTLIYGDFDYCFLNSYQCTTKCNCVSITY